MKNEMIHRINTVLSALNSITVGGKHNLANLSGSIAMLEEVLGMMADATIEEKAPKKAKNN